MKKTDCDLCEHTEWRGDIHFCRSEEADKRPNCSGYKEIINCAYCSYAVDFDEKEGTYYCSFYEGTVEPHDTCDCHEWRVGKEQQ